MRIMRGRSNALSVLGLWLLAGSACDEPKPPEFTYYEDRVAPVIEVGCAQQTTGCHIATKQYTAAGNLDLSSYDTLLQREDVLYASGPYTVGQLLLKGGDPIEIPVQTFDAPAGASSKQRFVAITTDIRHAGGALLREGSDGYAELKHWIEQGYQKDGRTDETLSISKGRCRHGEGAHPGFDASIAPADDESYRAFQREAQPVLMERCAGSSCHGSRVADFNLSCGETEEEKRWNYFVTLAHLDSQVSLSELLRRPLSTLRGGTYHEGGNVFASTDDSGYAALRKWAEGVEKRSPEALSYQPEDEGLRFFGNYVQPMLVKKGCMFANCHGPAMFHDLRLRTGSQGAFSRIAMDKNYAFAKAQLALASANPNDSRLIAKNLFPEERGGRGIAHRGGALFEDFASPATPEACAGIDVTSMPLDEVPPYCAFVAWHALERGRAIAAGELSAGPDYALVWVSRPLGVGDVRDFDTYRPGADLRRAELSLAADGEPALGAETSLLAACGLELASADIRGPAVSWDGKRLAFAARSSADEPLRLYEASSDGTRCAPLAGVAADKDSENGLFTHDFDPAYAPDGRLVFASTRGNVDGEGFGYAGPTRTPSQLAPNANLYVYAPKKKELRQLTFLLNQELQPSFMADGRVIFSTEKREPGFFQLAGRRQNLDGGDYHPLFAQRASAGFELATEIVELPCKNLAIVAAPFGAKDGAGTIAIVNRSIGPDQDDRDPNDRFYLHSLSFPKPGAFDGASGAFRSPAPLPSSWLVVSCDEAATSLKKGSFDFDLCALDPLTGKLAYLTGEAERAEIEAVAIYARDQQGVFRSRPDEANGNTRVDSSASDAEVHIADVPLLATLLFSNTRTGRPVDPRIKGLEVLEAEPPPAKAASFDDLAVADVAKDDFGSVFVSYRALGQVALEEDGSTKLRVPGGHPLLLRLTDEKGRALEFESGAPFEGEMVQREQMQLYPGERANQSFPRALFDGLCAGCHGSVSGHELDIAVDVDALTGASETLANRKKPIDLR